MGSWFCMDSKDVDSQKTNPQREEKIKTSVPSDQDLTIAKLKDLRDELHQQQQKLYKTDEKLEDEIKILLREKKKQRAKFAIQRKKLYEKYLDQIETKYLFIGEQIMLVEKMIIDKDLNEAMANTNKFLKDIQSTLNMDILDEAADTAQNLKMQDAQFDQLLSEYQVEGVDDELQKIEAEVLQNQLQQQQLNQVQFQPVENQQQYQAQEQYKIKELKQEILLN